MAVEAAGVKAVLVCPGRSGLRATVEDDTEVKIYSLTVGTQGNLLTYPLSQATMLHRCRCQGGGVTKWVRAEFRW